MNKKNLVFYVSVIVMVMLVAWGVIFSDSFQENVNNSFSFITENFSGYYIIVMSSFVVVALFLMFSKLGKIKLGEDNDKPEYSFFSWFAMLFSAGMGIGLVFWGAAEPLYHFMSPKAGIDSASREALEFTMQKSFLHWGFHPWAGYVIIGGSLAYMQYRKKYPGLISSLLIPIIGEKRAKGAIGYVVDILAIFATVAGIATSLGLGALQINSGLNFLFGVPENNTMVVIIVIIATFLFILSAVSGLDRGIKILSNTNVILALGMMILTFIIGPKIDIIRNFGIGIKELITNIPSDMLPLDLGNEGGEWYGWWTVFYWAWWIAWAPFVGSFIARISKGRTIREFIAGVLLAPAIASFIWFAIFGTAGINLGAEVIGDAYSNTSTTIFFVLEHYNLGFFISIITVILLYTFFVTSADSGTFVLGILSSNGNLNPTVKRKVIWGLIITSFTLVLMLASEGDTGLTNVQTASIVAALPFSLVMILAMISWIKALLQEKTNR